MQYLLLNQIKVHKANAISGFTWGFPAITHFLGFTHNLQRKLASEKGFSDISLTGTAVISHSQTTHTFGKYDQSFTQYRYQPYLDGTAEKSKSPPIIEEGKMDMTVSLLIGIDGNIGNLEASFLAFIERCCFTQKLAGGSVLSIDDIQLSSDEKKIKRKLMPGFTLMNRSHYLEEHYNDLKEEDPEADLLTAWLDFSALKQAARPLHTFITKHLSTASDELQSIWGKHLEEKPFAPSDIPSEVKAHFDDLTPDKKNKKLLDQWNHYASPTEKTPAAWEYLPKPFPGYLVPIMTGYKAISPVYENEEVANTRDSETPVCFVESVHSVGEWISPHRLPRLEETLWHYEHEEHWYLCSQNEPAVSASNQLTLDELALY